MRIHFLREFSVCGHPEILVPWERDVTTSPLYYERSNIDLGPPLWKRPIIKFFPKTFSWSNSTQHRPSLQRNLKMAYSSLQKLQREWVQTFGAANSRIVWVDKRYLLLVDGCLEYHRPIMTNACPPKWSQKSLRTKLVSILPGVYEVGNRKDFSEGKHMKN